MEMVLGSLFLWGWDNVSLRLEKKGPQALLPMPGNLCLKDGELLEESSGFASLLQLFFHSPPPLTHTHQEMATPSTHGIVGTPRSPLGFLQPGKPILHPRQHTHHILLTHFPKSGCLVPVPHFLNHNNFFSRGQ